MMEDISDAEFESMFEDEQNEEPVEQQTNRYKRPKAYRDLTDKQYRMCMLREPYAQLALTDKHSACTFIRNNEREFRSIGFPDRAKQEMRRVIMSGGYGNLTREDVELLDSVFGSHILSRPTPENSELSQPKYVPLKHPDTTLGWINYLRESTFHTFREWFNNDSNILRYFNKPDQRIYDEFLDLFEYQRMYGHELPFQQPYTPSEDDIWMNDILNKVKDAIE